LLHAFTHTEFLLCFNTFLPEGEASAHGALVRVLGVDESVGTLLRQHNPAALYLIDPNRYPQSAIRTVD